jgi:hypothetical protein
VTILNVVKVSKEIYFVEYQKLKPSIRKLKLEMKLSIIDLEMDKSIM